MKYLHFLQAWLLSLIFKPKKEIDKVLLVTASLQKKLEEIAKMENKIEAIIELLKEVSKVEDAFDFQRIIIVLKSKNYGQLNEKISLLLVIQEIILEAGHSSQFNHSNRGQLVTPEKVFLGGGDSGVWIKQASYWLAKRNLYQNDLKEDVNENSKTVWDCIYDQATDFVDSYIPRLIDKLEELKKEV